MPEVPLLGGSVSTVVRVGDTVRRRPAARAGFVHGLLDFFQRTGWDGAPRFLGCDEQGREILSFVDGHVAWQPDQPADVTGEASLVRVAELVREFHDLTTGTSLAGDTEVVDMIMWWQDRCWRGIQAGAAAGDPAMVGLRDGGAVRQVQASFRWVAEHRGELEGS